ncbi:Bardet-Biedl syndrome 4 protein [Hydra vulgaris]|uniref:Bardet-Biedl syndrome 4 protein n=1 Tax=Hydra vulgaris TaxID=6087 RepID=UPI0002B4B50B|nr:Bardet-Biedl syndrome 4 protein [Hydra vulgaris]
MVSESGIKPNSSNEPLERTDEKHKAETLKGVREKRGKAPEIHVFERKNWLIHLHYIRKEYESCKALIKEVLLESDTMCEYPLYVQALILREEGNIQEALEVFQMCQKINQTNVENWKQVARCLFLLGRHKMSLSVYEEGLKLSPKDWEIVHNMGVCYYYLNNTKKAKELFDQCLLLARHDITYIMLGKCFLKENDIDGALHVFLKAQEFSPESPEIMTTLGLLYLKMNEPAKAFDKFGSALVHDPCNVDAVLGIGAMIQQKDDFDVAQTKYKIAATEIPMSPFLWNNIGMCFFGKKKYVAAVSCLKRAAYLAPFEWSILYNLGLVHLTLQQYASAFHYLKAGITIQPKNGLLFMLLAVTLTYLNAADDAKQAYEQSILYSKNDPFVHLNYAVLLNKMGDQRTSAKQLSFFKKVASDVTDQELLDTANQLAAVLQVGSTFKKNKGD